MKKDYKIVNIRANNPLTFINPPIHGSFKNISLYVGDIGVALQRGATVEEVLPDGSTIKLNMENFKSDNNTSKKKPLFGNKKKDKNTKPVTPSSSPDIKEVVEKNNTDENKVKEDEIVDEKQYNDIPEIKDISEKNVPDESKEEVPNKKNKNAFGKKGSFNKKNK